MPRSYPFDLTDADWDIFAFLIPARKPGGRPPRHDRRDRVDVMCCVAGNAPQVPALANGLPRLSPMMARRHPGAAHRRSGDPE